MEITTALIKELRERTSAGMMDCKKALEETAGNMDEAIEWLREKGLSKAAKKAGRIAAEGLVDFAISNGSAAIVEVNSETDFVAKNEDFKSFVKDVAEQAARTSVTTVEELLNETSVREEGKTVSAVLNEKIATIGENLSVRRFEKLDTNAGTVVSYIHGGGKIGVLVQFNVVSDNAVVLEAGRNIAMQVAAINPLYLSADVIPAEYVEHEKAILREIVLGEGKAPEMVEKIVAGKINKQLNEVSLLNQSYVKDPELTITKYLENVSKEAGVNVTVVKFVRFEAGEGIEKKEENFAAEVAAQVASSNN